METSFSLPRFPDPSMATDEGLVAMGGDLSVPRLISAYRSGIYPCNGENDPLLWWSPDPRGIFLLEKGESAVRVNRSLRKGIKQGMFRVSFNKAFEEVIEGCANAQRPDGGHWITDEMIEAYTALHNLGIAHSVEVWQGDELAGGLYGVAMHAFFAGESMFYRIPNASKIALISLVGHLLKRKYLLLDCQMVTETTEKLGAVHIPRKEYLKRLKTALASHAVFDENHKPAFELR